MTRLLGEEGGGARTLCLEVAGVGKGQPGVEGMKFSMGSNSVGMVQALGQPKGPDVILRMLPFWSRICTRASVLGYNPETIKLKCEINIQCKNPSDVKNLPSGTSRSLFTTAENAPSGLPCPVLLSHQVRSVDRRVS